MRSFSVSLYRICLDPCCRSYTVLCVSLCYCWVFKIWMLVRYAFSFLDGAYPFYKYWRMVPVRWFFLMSKTYWIFCSSSSTTSWFFSLILSVPTALLDFTRWTSCLTPCVMISMSFIVVWRLWYLLGMYFFHECYIDWDLAYRMTFFFSLVLNIGPFCFSMGICQCIDFSGVSYMKTVFFLLFFLYLLESESCI